MAVCTKIYDLPLPNKFATNVAVKKFTRFTYFKRETNLVLNRAATLNLEGLGGLQQAISACQKEIQLNPHIVLCGDITDVQQMLWSTDEEPTGISSHSTETGKCFDIFLYCTKTTPDTKTAADIRKLKEKFKCSSILKQMLLVDLNPQTKDCEASGHTSTEGKDPNCERNKLYEKFKLALHKYRFFDDEDIKEIVDNRHFAYKDTTLMEFKAQRDKILEKVDVLLEKKVLGNLRNVHDILEKKLECNTLIAPDACSFNRPNGAKDQITNLLSNRLLLKSWNAESSSSSPSTPDDKYKLILDRFATTFSKCMHCAFIADLTLNTKLVFFSSVLTSRKPEVYWDAALPEVTDLLQEMPIQYKKYRKGNGESVNVPDVRGLQKLLAFRLNQTEGTEVSLADCLEKMFQEEFVQSVIKEFAFALHQVMCEIWGLFAESKVTNLKDLGKKSTYRGLDEKMAIAVLGVPHVVGVGLAFGRMLVEVDIDEDKTEEIKRIEEKVINAGGESNVQPLIYHRKKLFDTLNETEPDTSFLVQDELDTGSLVQDEGMVQRPDLQNSEKSPDKEGIVHQAGDKVRGFCDGSLAGFAYWFPGGGKTPDVCGLISYHILEKSRETTVKEVIVEGRSKSTKGDVFLSNKEFDIAAFKFETSGDFHHSQIERRLKSSDGKLTEFELCKFEDNDMKILAEKRVHIWGAVTAPGFGRIIGQAKRQQKVILIERIGDKAFSVNGDSGSFVLRDTPEANVRVLCMLQGERGDGLYATIKLCEGLESLNSRQKTEESL